MLTTSNKGSFRRFERSSLWNALLCAMYWKSALSLTIATIKYPMKRWVIISFDRWEQWGLKRLRKILQITELVNGKAELWVHVCLISKPRLCLWWGRVWLRVLFQTTGSGQTCMELEAACLPWELSNPTF